MGRTVEKSDDGHSVIPAGIDEVDVRVFPDRCALLLLLLVGARLPALGQSNIDPTDRFCWGENIGWVNWRDANGGADGAVVGSTFLSGFCWSENTGWINLGDGRPADGAAYRNLTGEDFGVNIDDRCNLFGMAWGENIGWINFDTRSRGEERARIDCEARRLRGYVWGENVGWISLDDSEGFVAFEDLPSCCGPDCPRVQCDAIDVTGPPGDVPGQYVVRVSATVPAGAEALYTFRVENSETGESADAGPVTESSAQVTLSPGTWVFSASVGTHPDCPFADCDPVNVVVQCVEEPDSVAIEGPEEGIVGSPVELTAALRGADEGGMITYDWDVVAGAGQILGRTDTSAARVVSSAGGEVTVRVRSGDGVCDDEAEARHTILFRECPAPGSVTCDGVQVSGPPGNTPGEYRVTASGTVPGDERVLFLFRVRNAVTGQSAEAGPGPGSQVTVTVSAGIWDIVVAVGTSAECPFVACDPVRIVVTDAPPPGVGPFARGDCNADRRLDVADAICILEWLHADGPAPGCVAVTNVNGDGAVDTSDAIYVLLFLAGSAAQPAAPFPDCGASSLPIDGELGCESVPGYCR